MNFKKKLVKEISPFFEYIYSCCKVWSAWSYSTMEQDDFIPLSEDEDLLIEIAEGIFKLNEITISSIENILEEYGDIYYNPDIDVNFNSYDFQEDWIEYIDIESLIFAIGNTHKQYKLSDKIKEF